jgi:hypothetical protein
MIGFLAAIKNYFVEKPRRPQLIWTSTGEPQGSTLIAELRRLLDRP